MYQTENLKVTFIREALVFESCLSICQPTQTKPSISFLTKDEKEQLKQYSNQREVEFLFSRLIIKNAIIKFFVKTKYDCIEIIRGIFGQPILSILNSNLKLNVSISHKANLIGSLIFDERHPTALDIEYLCPDRELVFISKLTVTEKKINAEKSFCGIFIWTAKEALSKILRCGMTVTYDFLEVTNFEYTDEVCTGEFLYFKQYKFICFKKYNHAVTIVFPRNSQILVEKY